MTNTIISIIIRTLVGATPLVIAGVGGIFGERAGITNIGLDGNMLFGAFAAAIGSYFFGNAWMGLICGVLAGTLVGLFHAYLCVTVKINHVVSGLAINIFASSLTVYILSVLFKNKGNSPAVPTLPKVNIPLLGELPVIGPVFINLSVITLAAPVIVAAAYIFLNKHKFGMHVLSVGQKPQAAAVMGINVAKVQYQSILIGGFCSGLAGSFLSISNMNMFVRGMVSGRGYIAIATILFGCYRPIMVALAGLFFGFVDAMQIALQGTVNIPGEFIQMLPYLFTIVAVMVVMSRENKPKNCRQPQGKRKAGFLLQ